MATGTPTVRYFAIEADFLELTVADGADERAWA